VDGLDPADGAELVDRSGQVVSHGAVGQVGAFGDHRDRPSEFGGDTEAVEGRHFQLIAKPVPGWRGIVDCEVLEIREPSLLRYTWVRTPGENPTYVSYRIDPLDGGTRFTFEHTGFTGIGGFAMAKLLGAVRTTMLTTGLPAVLDDLTDDGILRPGSTLRPKDLS